MTEILNDLPAAAWKNCRGFGLSDREIEVAALMVTGATNGAIARRLCIAYGTVAKHVCSVYEKLGIEETSGNDAYRRNQRTLATTKLVRLGVPDGR